VLACLVAGELGCGFPRSYTGRIAKDNEDTGDPLFDVGDAVFVLTRQPDGSAVLATVLTSFPKACDHLKAGDKVRASTILQLNVTVPKASLDARRGARMGDQNLGTSGTFTKFDETCNGVAQPVSGSSALEFLGDYAGGVAEGRSILSGNLGQFYASFSATYCDLTGATTPPANPTCN
jgi:hypothetical protein